MKREPIPTALGALVVALLLTGAAFGQTPSGPTKNAPAKSSTGTPNVESKLNAAGDAYEAGRYDDAARLFREVVALSPRHALAWHFLGQSLAKKGDQEGAAKAYEQVLKIQPTGSIAERTRQLLMAATRPKFPFEISEDLLRAIEGSEQHACMRKYAIRPMRVHIVVREDWKNGSKGRSTRRYEISDLGGGLTQSTHTSESEGYSFRWRYTTIRWAGTWLGGDSYDSTTGQRNSYNRLTVYNTKGSTCPFRIGAEMESSTGTSYVNQGSTGRGETKRSGKCRIVEKVPASTLHPELKGDAYVEECQGEGTNTEASGKIHNYSGKSKNHFLASLGIYFSDIGDYHPLEKRHFLPIVGYTYSDEEKTYTYERVEIEFR